MTVLRFLLRRAKCTGKGINSSEVKITNNVGKGKIWTQGEQVDEECWHEGEGEDVRGGLGMLSDGCWRRLLCWWWKVRGRQTICCSFYISNYFIFEVLEEGHVKCLLFGIYFFQWFFSIVHLWISDHIYSSVSAHILLFFIIATVVVVVVKRYFNLYIFWF